MLICLRMHVNVRQVIWKCGNPYFFHTKPDFGKLAIITVLKVSTCWFLVSPFLFSCITRWYRQFCRGLSGFGPGWGDKVLERPVFLLRSLLCEPVNVLLLQLRSTPVRMQIRFTENVEKVVSTFWINFWWTHDRTTPIQADRKERSKSSESEKWK